MDARLGQQAIDLHTKRTNFVGNLMAAAQSMGSELAAPVINSIHVPGRSSYISISRVPPMLYENQVLEEEKLCRFNSLECLVNCGVSTNTYKCSGTCPYFCACFTLATLCGHIFILTHIPNPNTVQFISVLCFYFLSR
jgi:hypothetical protein